MMYICPVCSKEYSENLKKCALCGFMDDLGLHREWPIAEDAQRWLETVVKPYREKWHNDLARLSSIVENETTADEKQNELRRENPSESFVRVAGGTFQMGSNSGLDDDEKPAHSVTVKGFSIGMYEVTQKEWTAVMGTTVRQQRDKGNTSWPLYDEDDNYPMYYVSWNDAVEYCNKLSQKEGLAQAYRISNGIIVCDFTANGYRLPTEAEWEFAAKGGNQDLMEYTYSGSNSVEMVAWYKDNSGNSMHPVGRKAPNSLGIYDMSGNMWEWCWDWLGDYSSEAQTDPTGPFSGIFRICRGGAWNSAAVFTRSIDRSFHLPYTLYYQLGFRLVRP